MKLRPGMKIRGVLKDEDGDSSRDTYIEEALVVCVDYEWFLCHNNETMRGLQPRDCKGYNHGWFLGASFMDEFPSESVEALDVTEVLYDESTDNVVDFMKLVSGEGV